jgi:hypothetical protein
MANVKQSFNSSSAFSKAFASSLANSPTAGWQSNVIDNSANLYLDALVTLELAAVNTAPANSKAIFMYAFALVDTSGSAYTGTGSTTPVATESSLAFPDITANAIPMPLLGVVPYPAQNCAINGGPFSVAACFGGILPPKWGVAMINYSGMTLSVTNIKYIEQYNTVT